jgi:hypothetical protein
LIMNLISFFNAQLLLYPTVSTCSFISISISIHMYILILIFRLFPPPLCPAPLPIWLAYFLPIIVTCPIKWIHNWLQQIIVAIGHGHDVGVVLPFPFHSMFFVVRPAPTQPFRPINFPFP